MRPSFVLLLGALLLGCQPSPDDLVFVFGQVTDADGAAVVGAEVKLLRGSGPCGSLRPIPSAPAEIEVPTFSAFLQDTTEGDGNFVFEMMVGEAQSRAGPQWGQRCFEVQVGGERSTFRFDHPLTDVPVPDLLRWDAPLVSTPLGAGGVDMQVPRAPPVPAPAPGQEDQDPPFLEVRTQAGGVVWTHPLGTEPGSLKLTPALLEDFTGLSAQGVVDVVSLVEQTNAFQSSFIIYRMRVTTEPHPLPTTNAVPSSRGATCQPDPCPFTNGLVGDGALLPVDPVVPMPPTEVTLTLATEATLGYVVLRDATVFSTDVAPVAPATVDVVVEGSLDGAAWTELQTLQKVPVSDALFLASPLSASTVLVKQVRLRIPNGIILGLSELSYFDTSGAGTLYSVP